MSGRRNSYVELESDKKSKILAPYHNTHILFEPIVNKLKIHDWIVNTGEAPLMSGDFLLPFLFYLYQVRLPAPAFD